MYKNHLAKTFLVSVISISLAHCGGGSGGDSSNGNPVNVAGRWTGALTKTVDSCPATNAPQTLNFTHVVSQNGDAVTVVTADGKSYLGNTLSGTGFSVDNSGGSVTVNGEVCSITNRIEYQNIDDDSDQTAGVDVRTLRNCDVGGDCELAYTGTAARGAVFATPIPGTTPTPTPTTIPGTTPVATPISMTTPIAGGCAAINPRPAAGTYGGDGGCGISEATYRITSSTVILEPFGSNGATSFAISGDNVSAATSSRSDLTIKDIVGYSCSLTCSAPGTFTVSCFKEGGVSCVEKF